MQKKRGGSVDNFGALPLDDFGALPMESSTVPAQPETKKSEKTSFGFFPDLIMKALFSEATNPSTPKSAAAATLQGGTDFINSLSGLTGNGRAIDTNFYDKFDVDPNLLTQAGSGLISVAPYALAPELLAPRIGLAGLGMLPLAGRTALRSAAGVAENEGMTRGRNEVPTIAGDALSALLYGATGALGDVLPMKAGNLIKAMQKNKLPNEAIVEGNRVAEFPDVGNVVGNPQAAEKWKDLTQAWFSPAKEAQEAAIAQVPTTKFGNLQSADTEAMQLYKDLVGKPRVKPGENVPNTLQDAISNDLTRVYKNNSKVGGNLFKEIEPDLQKAVIGDFKNTQSAAQSILSEAKANASLGVTDEALRKDIIKRAENAVELGRKSPNANSKIVTLTDKERGRYPINSIIKEERNLSDIAADLKASGNNAAARYYDNLAKSYQTDINAVLEGNYPDIFQKMNVARDYWKNNVVPFRESSAVRSLINNTFDESEAALNLASTLTNGKNSQLLSILPDEVKNRIAGELLFKHGFNAVGDTAHLATDLSRTVNNIEPARLADILGAETKAKLKNISKSVDQNADVLKDLNKATKTVGGEGGGAVADITSHGAPGFFARVGTSALNTGTAPFWSRFLDVEKSPEVLSRVMNQTPTTLADIRAIKSKAPISEKISPRGLLGEILSNPNLTRIPLAGTAEGVTNKKERKKK